MFQLVAGLVLVLAALTPLVECFDRWDTKTTVPANDTELRLTVFFTGVGAALTLAQLLPYIPPLLIARMRRWHGARSAVTSLRYPDEQNPSPTASPPLTPLRI